MINSNVLDILFLIIIDQDGLEFKITARYPDSLDRLDLLIIKKIEAQEVKTAIVQPNEFLRVRVCQELQGTGVLLLLLGELLPAEDVVTMLEKGDQDGVVVVELALGPSNMESFDVLVVCVLENGLVVEE